MLPSVDDFIALKIVPQTAMLWQVLQRDGREPRLIRTFMMKQDKCSDCHAKPPVKYGLALDGLEKA